MKSQVRIHKKNPVTIIVKDQFPVSVIKEINVDDLSAPEAQIEKETGIATWNISLQPAQEKKVKMGYV
jgi:C4-type Zn-finger protein